MSEGVSTNLIAIYAAIVATGALALEVRRWIESGPNLTVSVIPQARLFGGNIDDHSEYLAVTVTNRGDRPTTINNYTLHQYASILHRWIRRSTRSAIVIRPDEFGGYPLPYLLLPGTEWRGMASYDPELIDWAKTGQLYVGIHSSHSRFPIIRHVFYEER